jgi:ketosteroid isomerase-like protein
VVVERTVVASSGDLAYTIGFERSHVSVDGGPPRDAVLQVTHIYRRIDGDWKLMHRHADFPSGSAKYLRQISGQLASTLRPKAGMRSGRTWTT